MLVLVIYNRIILCKAERKPYRNIYCNIKESDEVLIVIVIFCFYLLIPAMLTCNDLHISIIIDF